MRVAVILVAAGRGNRAGGELPKQYVPLAGRASLRRAAETLLAEPRVRWLLPVVHPADGARYDTAMSGLVDDRLLAPVSGGDTRARSVAAGLAALVPHAPEAVLIHDAARPFVPARVVAGVIAALDHAEGAFAALPVVDALWRVRDGIAAEAVPRDGLWRAQTPQGFRFAPLSAAYRDHDGSGTDDVAVARAAGMALRVVAGDERNYKVTTPEDLKRAEADAARIDAETAG